MQLFRIPTDAESFKKSSPKIVFCLLLPILLLSVSVNSRCEENFSRAFLDKAASYKEAMDYKKAISEIEDNKNLLNQVQDINFLSRLYYLNGQSEKAIATLSAIENKDWISYLYLGLSYEDLGETTLAVKNYLESLKFNENFIALYRLAKIYYKHKSYEKASRFFSKLIALDSSTRFANYYLAECFLKTGDYKRAYTYSAKSINFYPDNKDIKTQLLAIKDKIGKAFFIETKRTVERARDMVRLMFYKREKNVPTIKVGIATDLKDFTFRCGGDFTVSDSKNSFKGEKNKFYKIIFQNNRLYLTDNRTGTVYKKFRNQVFIKSRSYPFYILDVSYGRTNFWHKKIDRIYRGDFKLIANKDITLINIISIEEYLYGVLPAEILASYDKEALRAQAIAARTLAFRSIKQQRHANESFDVCADVHCQVYQGMSVETAATNRAVDETKGQIVLCKSEPIETIYHSNCGGCLRPDVFSKKEYYAQGFDSTKSYRPMSFYEEENWFTSFPENFCAHSYKSNYRWQRVYDEEDFLLAFGYPLKNLTSIIPQEKITCGAYKLIQVETSKDKTNIKGDFNIRNYFDKLRSSAFKVDIKFSSRHQAKMIFFWGAGFGHGAGMCQEGAQFMAKSGFTYQEIIRHYYPHTEIVQRY
ncbi:MAG: SpoIID/LytB domain-containing protein [Candidatus Omnitrophica bacterium]|nr:SpoIID/LytB domain-containing protein [Candidatus Omnitrophota bacterium]